jgi:hypothetical protein
MEKKPKSKTVSSYKKFKAIEYGLNAGAFICPLAPASIITAINWEEWFAKSSTSLPFGFACLLLTVIVAVVGVLKSDTVLKKADIALYFFGVILCLIGITSLFLASLFTQMGWLWIFTAMGVIGSGTCVTVKEKAVLPIINEYQGLISEFGLDKKSRRMAERSERARKEAEAEANRQATE